MTGPVEGVLDDSELAVAADELNACLVREVDAEAGTRAQRLPDRDRLGLAFGLDGRCVSIFDYPTGRPVRRLVREDSVDRRGILEASRRVDDIAGGHALARLRASIEPNERLACGNGDPHLHVVLVECPVADGKTGADGALRVVLVRDGGAEERHHRVTDELLDGAAVALELGAEAFVVGPEQRLDVLGVELLRALREADEVAEHDRDDLALSPWFGHRQAVFASSRSPRSMKRIAPTER